MYKVYLAGGMKTAWREQVKKEVPFVLYLDPTTSGLKDEVDYTEWDLEAINMADIVFGYLEKENPSGLGLMFEFGYTMGWQAKDDEKVYIFVNEKEDDPMNPYLGMARACAFRYATSLERGINILYRLVSIERELW